MAWDTAPHCGQRIKGCFAGLISSEFLILPKCHAIIGYSKELNAIYLTPGVAMRHVGTKLPVSMYTPGFKF